MPKKNSHGVEDIQIGYDPRNGNLIDPLKPDQTEIVVYRLTPNGNYILDPVTRQYVTDRIPIKFEDNVPFSAQMEITLPASLKKTTRIAFKDLSTGRIYYTSTKWFHEIWNTAVIDKGKVTGKWAFVRNSFRNNLILLP